VVHSKIQYPVLGVSFCLVAALPLLLSLLSYGVAVGAEEYVYCGYVPPSTDIGEVDELVDGGKTDYTVPSGYSLLDITGLEDDTGVGIWDIYANQKLNSTIVGKLERQTFFIHHGTYFKIVADHRVAAMLAGGQMLYNQYEISGTSTFYPSVEGGFRGREFIFTAAPASSPAAGLTSAIGYNFFLMALEDADWHLEDRVNKWSTDESTNQRGIRMILLQSRINHLGYHLGVGNDVVFHLTSSGDVMVSCAALNDFVAVPAIMGGYVGKLFYAPVHLTREEPGNRTAIFIVMPLEPGKVTVYSRALDIIAERTFTSQDVADMAYWFHDLGAGKFELIVKSEGDITFMVGQTQGGTTIDWLGDDIAVMGANPNQEIRFYAPTMAILFASQETTVTIDGRPPSMMPRDGFAFLDSGPHSVKADGSIIVEILAVGSGWDDWGSYLIAPSDIARTYTEPKGFMARAQDYSTYIAMAVIVVIVVVAAAVLLPRHRRRTFQTPTFLQPFH